MNCCRQFKVAFLSKLAEAAFDISLSNRRLTVNKIPRSMMQKEGSVQSTLHTKSISSKQSRNKGNSKR